MVFLIFVFGIFEVFIIKILLLLMFRCFIKIIVNKVEYENKCKIFKKFLVFFVVSLIDECVRSLVYLKIVFLIVGL